ncbi:hypothetical protein [Flagellimonas flava]|uniref:hypothetical protein n=1 Tax=Flagellimonas flava TaxID=570519 RepID=UPI003D6471D7
MEVIEPKSKVYKSWIYTTKEGNWLVERDHAENFYTYSLPDAYVNSPRRVLYSVAVENVGHESRNEDRWFYEGTFDTLKEVEEYIFKDQSKEQ